MKKIKAVIFDWGGVLIDNPVPGMLRYCAAKLAIPPKKLINLYRKFSNDFQTDRISEKILWQKIKEKLNGNDRLVKNNFIIQDIEPSYDLLWFNAFKYEYRPKKGMFQLATTLKNNDYKIGLLSNTEKKIMEFYHQLNYDMIDVAVFSCTQGIAKPDERIYHIMLSKMNVSAEETVFIDDKMENVTSAQLIGMKAIIFKNQRQVRQELQNFEVDTGSVR
jgi:epoxide hydrolase-like predicted phosphatase